MSARMVAFSRDGRVCLHIDAQDGEAVVELGRLTALRLAWRLVRCAATGRPQRSDPLQGPKE